MNASEKFNVARADRNMPNKRSEAHFASWQFCTESVKRDVRSHKAADGKMALATMKDRNTGRRTLEN